MARFKFRMQPVLDQRQREERRHQRQVAEIEIERLDLENQLRGLNGAIEAEKADWRDRVAGPGPRGTQSVRGSAVDLRGARMQASASISMIADAQRLVLRLAGVHARIERARQALLEAATRRRAVEKLREKYFEAWQSEQKRREEQEHDDLTVMRFGKGSAELSEVIR